MVRLGFRRAKRIKVHSPEQKQASGYPVESKKEDLKVMLIL